MIKAFKRLTSIISLALIVTMIFVPCTVFFFDVPDVSAAASETDKPAESVELVTKTYKEDRILSSKQDNTALSRAQAFDSAKEKTAQAVAELSSTTDSSQTTYGVSSNDEYLLDISNPDKSYISYAVSLSDYDRDILERLVMGEAGGEGFIGCCLVAQAIKDTMITDGYTSIEAVRIALSYEASLYNTPNEDAKSAVDYIFGNGGAAVQHRIIYFYAPAMCYSGFHESQNFVVQYANQRFFDRW